ncbi:hypothetical protein [Celeribacter sp.]|uniref:hypothetical protein n=1 Tax=Celeribacter sp. TaxID=1890673 RepID=UPI003A93F416
MASSSVIGALRVNLGLDSAQFSKGVKSARSDMTAFSSKIVKVAAGLATTFAASMSAMGVGAINAAADVKQLSQMANTLPAQFQGWSAGARSVGIEQGKLADILKDMSDRVGDFTQTGGGPMADFFENIAPKVGITAEAFRGLSGADALQLYVDSLEKANLSQADMTFYMEAIASDSTALLPLLQNGGAAMAEYAQRAKDVGYSMSDEMRAGLDEGKVALLDMNMAVTGMRNTLGAMAVPAIQALAAAVTSVAIVFHEHAGIISDALRTVAGTAAVVATFFTAKYAVAVGATAVRAMATAVSQSVALEMALGAQSRAAAVASLAVKGLGVAWRAMWAAATIGVSVVLGYLLGQFSKLVTAAGGFGEAMGLLKDAAAEAFDRIKLKAAIMSANIEAGWKDIQSSAYSAMASIVSGGVEFANRYVGIYRGAFEAIKAVWSALPSSMGDVVYGAANITVKGVEAMVKKAAGLIDSLTQGAADSWLGEKLGLKGTALADSISFAGVDNPFAGEAKGLAEQAKAAFLEGFQTDTFNQPEGLLSSLTGTSDELAAQADAYREAGTMLARAADRPMTAWKKLKEVVTGSKEEIAEIPPVAAPAAAAMDQLGSAGGKAADGVKKVETAADSMKDTVGGAFKDLLTGVKSFGEAAASVLNKVADMLLDSAFNTLWSGGSGGGGGLGGIVGSILGGLGIGANANGTSNWRGGLTSINERGGEIVDLPSGTRIIPHDVSNRMADRMGGGVSRTQVEVVPSDYFDVHVKEISDKSASDMGKAVIKSIPGQIEQYSNYPRKRS